MDNQAFRSLLSSSSTGAAASGSSLSGTRNFGALPKRASNKSSSSSAQLVPRTTDAEKKHQKPRPPPKNSATGERYIDRAADRRTGKETSNEFADVEKLHREWRAKYDAAETDEEKREVEEQMAYLGGDAVHSILVRGLDYALLEQQKAKAEGRTLLGNVDDDLEAAYAENVDEKGKRSKGEIVDALKRRRKVDTEGDERQAEEAQRTQAMSKFKPIGSTTSQQPSGGDDNVIITKDGKRLRKKKKKDPAESEAAKEPPGKDASTSSTTEKLRRDASTARAKMDRLISKQHGSSKDSRKEGPSTKTSSASAPTSVAQSNEPEPSISSDDTKPTNRGSAQPSDDADTRPSTTVTASTTAAPPSDDEEDEDIFADAGRWSGLANGDDDEDDGGGDSQGRRESD